MCGIKQIAFACSEKKFAGIVHDPTDPFCTGTKVPQEKQPCNRPALQVVELKPRNEKCDMCRAGDLREQEEENNEEEFWSAAYMNRKAEEDSIYSEQRAEREREDGRRTTDDVARGD
jgi:hypothetical protein